MVKRVLMIAYHYPPMRGSSGIQRTLKFSQYLPNHGWQPLVLSAHPRAYASHGPDQMGDIPPEVAVHRAFALDTARHLSIRGRYAGFMALPDRWASWLLGAIPTGLRLIWRERPQLIWSTYPIASANLIGLILRRLTGLPWIADLRDPITDVGYPADPLTRKIYSWIEAQTVRHCTVAVFTTPGAIETYRRRFPEIPLSRFHLIENGFDEENFAQAESDQAQAPEPVQRPFTLLHSGIIYPSERDPAPMFAAIAALRDQGLLDASRFQLVLRAAGHEGFLNKLIAQFNIGDLVKLAPHISYREALREMLTVDALLILQAANCNHQVPAKLYEYLRARRPILALTDPAGDTATTLRKAGIDTIAPLDSKDAIMAELTRFIGLASAGQAPLATPSTIEANSRRARAGELGQLLDRTAAQAGRTEH